ncbi:MAG TPA: hypothetical protein VG708_03790, partial [Mycobacteriales bacterium]|nr:hypothetical protein [Mycobacteriales bacterium]
GHRAARLWLVSAAGRAVRPLTPRAVNVLRAMWAPQANRLAVVTHRRGKHADQLRLVWPDGSSRIVISAPTIGAISWAPTGGRLALSTDVFRHHKWHSRLEVLRPAAAQVHRHVVTAVTGNVLDLAAWWPDGRRLLAWFDPMGSGSLAADGLPLDVVTMSGHRHRIAKTMLGYGSWIALSRAKSEIAVIEGGDRVLTAGHKAVAICTPRKCDRVRQPANQVSMDPAWSPAGRLAVVRDRAYQPNSSGPPFAPSYVQRVQDSGDITIVTKSTARRLTVAGHGATAPQWGRDGSLLVIRHEAVWLVRKSAREVAAPLTFDRRATFYGHVPWLRAVAWTEALPGAVADAS